MRPARLFAVAIAAAVALGFGGAAVASAAPQAPAVAKQPVKKVVKKVVKKAAGKAAVLPAAVHTITTDHYYVTASRLHVRSGPGVKYRVVGVLKRGDSVGVYGKAVNGFRQIGKNRWVSAKYISFDDC